MDPGFTLGWDVTKESVDEIETKNTQGEAESFADKLNNVTYV